MILTTHNFIFCHIHVPTKFLQNLYKLQQNNNIFNKHFLQQKQIQYFYYFTIFLLTYTSYLIFKQHTISVVGNITHLIYSNYCHITPYFILFIFFLSYILTVHAILHFLKYYFYKLHFLILKHN